MQKRNVSLTICITGGIACGKTTVGEFCRAHGFKVLEADKVCHELMEPGQPVHDAVKRAFGSAITKADGTIDRQELGRLVFNAPGRLAQLNAIVHPAARAELNACRRTYTGSLVVIVPLVYEAGMDNDWDTIICVATPPPLQLARLRARGLDETAARARIAAQMAQEEKMRRADYVIYNAGKPTLLRRQMQIILKRFKVKQEK